MTAISLRPAIASDYDRISFLCGQLGYRASTAEIAQRVEMAGHMPHFSHYVAIDEAHLIVGWAYVFGICTLEVEPYLEVAALIVDEAKRGLGIGKTFMMEFERWAIATGYKSVALRSQVSRVDAHRFYRSLGYSDSKTSMRFNKELVQPTERACHCPGRTPAADRKKST